jgi:hypothetical protein
MDWSMTDATGPSVEFVPAAYRKVTGGAQT